jgi:beta-galactosidase
MSGTRTPANAMSDQTPPGLLAELAGLTAEEVRPYQHGQTHEVVFKTGPMAGKTATVGTWIEVLQPGNGAEIMAEYRGEPVAGRAAITHNRLGKGRVFYMGVYLPAPALREFLRDCLPEFPVKHIPDGLEVTVRRDGQRRLLFLINHSGDRRDLMLPGQFTDLLSGEPVGPKVALAKNGVLVLRV